MKMLRLFLRLSVDRYLRWFLQFLQEVGPKSRLEFAEKT